MFNHGSIETIYRLSNKEGEGDENLERIFYLPRIKEFVVSPQKDSLFMVVLPHGILKSGNSGRQWQEFHSLGVPVRDINQLVFCPVCQHRGNPARSPQCTLLMCAATKKGVYTFQDTEWVGFNKGIATQEITALTVDSQGVIYAATDAGIYSNPELPLLMRNEAFYCAQDD
ncbi:MAG: hypothetical protein WC450_08055, partial [Candidatus Omnitrophota bacterium]